LTGRQLDLTPFTTTLWPGHPASTSPSRAYAHPKLWGTSFSTRMLWGTVSKALKGF